MSYEDNPNRGVCDVCDGLKVIYRGNVECKACSGTGTVEQELANLRRLYYEEVEENQSLGAIIEQLSSVYSKLKEFFEEKS